MPAGLAALFLLLGNQFLLGAHDNVYTLYSDFLKNWKYSDMFPKNLLTR